MAAAIPIVREMLVKRMNVVLYGWGKNAVFRSVQGRAEDSSRGGAADCTELLEYSKSCEILLPFPWNGSMRNPRLREGGERLCPPCVVANRSGSPFAARRDAGSRRRGPSA